MVGKEGKTLRVLFYNRPLQKRRVRLDDGRRDLAAVLEKVGRDALTDEDIREAQEAICESGALDEMEALISSLTDQAINALKALPILDSAKVELELLAHYVSHRHT